MSDFIRTAMSAFAILVTGALLMIPLIGFTAAMYFLLAASVITFVFGVVMYGLYG